MADVTQKLWRAAESGDVESVARLLPRVPDLNIPNSHGMTVLMKAAGGGHARVVRMLLEHGADPNLIRNDKFTALALAAFFGHTETVKTLMEYGARTEDVTRSGASARTWATARTFAEVARCLDKPEVKTPAPPPVQLRRRQPRSRIVALGVVASFVLIVCFGLGALVLSNSEAHDLPPATPPSQPPPVKVENTPVTIPQPQPAAEPEPERATVQLEPKTASLVRPTIKKSPAPTRETPAVTVVTEKPVEQPAEKVQPSEPPVVAKPKFAAPKPPALSPQIIAPTKKAKVIQWP